MLGCRDGIDLLDDYLDGKLESAVARALEMHLAGCEDCTAFLETYRGTIRASRRLGESDLPAALRQRLLAFVRQHTQR